MPLSKRMQLDTLKEQHDEIAYVSNKLDELGSSFMAIGLTQVYDELIIYLRSLNDAMRKLKAVIESLTPPSE